MNKFNKVLILIFLSFSLFAFFHNAFSKKEIKQSQKSLKEVVEKSMEGTKGTYGIAIKNLKTGETYFNNESHVFDSGSLYKLWIMAEVYRQIEEGKFTEDETISGDVSTLNSEFNIDPDSAEQTEGTVSFTVSDALNQMITISHNYAALLLSEKIKLSSVAKFLKDNDFIESSVGTEGDNPKTTALDIMHFFEKLYRGELANKENTDKMISLLKKQQIDDGLVKYLPQGTVVANKTGDIGWFKHDAGIVFTSKGDYIIAIMSESEFPAAAQERIAGVSKSVFDYFNR